MERECKEVRIGIRMKKQIGERLWRVHYLVGIGGTRKSFSQLTQLICRERDSREVRIGDGTWQHNLVMIQGSETPFLGVYT